MVLEFYTDIDGFLGISFNGSNRRLSTMQIIVNQWRSASLRFEEGIAELYIAGVLAHTATTGPLSSGGDRVITTNDSGSGSNHLGCIRNIQVYDGVDVDPVAGVPTLGQWGMIILGLSFLIIGVLSFKSRYSMIYEN